MKAGTNYWGPGFRKGSRMCCIFFVFLGSIIKCRLYKLTLPNRTLIHCADKSQCFRFGLNIFGWYDLARGGGASVKHFHRAHSRRPCSQENSLHFCALKVGAVHFSDTLLAVYEALRCHILNNIITVHIHRVRKSNIARSIVFVLIFHQQQTKRVWLCKNSVRTTQYTLRLCYKNQSVNDI